MQKIAVRILDICVWTFFLFPFFLGGAWIELHGKHRGITNYSIGLAVCLVLALAIWRVSRTTIEIQQMSSLRFARRLWCAWERSLKNKPRRSILGITIFFGALLALTALRRHWALKSNAGDFGIFINAIWNLSFRGEYISSFKDGINLFADHQSPAFWLLVPWYKLWPYPETLLIAQSLGLAAGGAAAYLIARQYCRLEQLFCAIVPLLYFLYPSTRNANLFDFHPETIMLAAFLWAIAGLQSANSRNRVLGIVALCIGVAGKESGGPMLVGVGLSWILGAGPPATQAFTRRLGWLLVPCGVALFLATTKYVPAWFGGQYVYGDLYRHLGSSMSEIIASPLTRPQIFFPHVLGASRLQFFAFLLAPLLFMPLLSPRHFPSFVIPLLMIFMPIDDHRVGRAYHYGIEPSVGMFWALGCGYLNTRHLLRQLSPKLICWATLIATLLLAAPSDVYRLRSYVPTAQAQWMRRKLFACIAPDVPIAAPSNVAPHLAGRPWANWLPKLQHPTQGEVACVIVDPTQNPWPMTQAQMEEFGSETIPKMYRKIYGCRSTEVYARSGRERECMICQPEC